MTAKKPSKKTATKKASSKKTTKKAAPKKATKKAATKKAAKKAAPKKAAKKVAPAKKITKASAVKKTSIKKKVVKKAAPKKGKKAAKKTVSRVKKASKKIVKTTVVTTTTTTTVSPTETHYLLIVDESGSMQSTRQQTLDGINEQIQTIKNLSAKYPDQKYFVSIIKFDNVIVPLFENIPSDKVRELELKDYSPNATTALHDAIGISVKNLQNKISSKIDSGEADAYVVIITDGIENASREYNAASIKTLIESLEATKMWTFTYVGANQDAVLVSSNLGIAYNNTSNWVASGAGSNLAFKSLSSSLGKRAMYRSAGVFTNDSYLSEVVANNSIGENEALLDLSGTVSAEDIQKAKDALANAKNTTNSTSNNS